MSDETEMSLKCVLTCGCYPRVWKRFMKRSQFASWTLKSQITFGVMTTLLILQVFLLTFLIINIKLYFVSTYTQLSEIIDNQQHKMLKQSLADTGYLIESTFGFAQLTMSKQKNVMTQAVHPTYFNEYPINYKAIQIHRFESLPTEWVDPENPNISYMQTTYNAAQSPLGKGLYELVQKVSLFNQLWARMINMKIGPNKDINLMRTYFILSQNQCDTVLMTYPGQSYSDWNDLDSQGCLSPSEQFGSVWNPTMTTGYNDFHLFSY